jgi:thioredoxin reductase (NADPH)
MSSDNKEKVIILGGGPAGLGAAIYTARAFLNPLVIAGSPPGGQLTLTTDVENWPGFISIQGPELVQKVRDHAEHFGTRFIDENVVAVDFGNPKNLSVTLSDGKTYVSESILLATGASARWLELESEMRLRGRGVSACATCDGFFFRDKVVAVVGGGDTAMEEALVLTKFATKVYILHRRDEFRASQIMQKRVKEHEKIEILWGTEVEEVLGENVVEGIRVRHTTDASRGNAALNGDTLAVQGLFIAIGHIPNTLFLKDSNSGVLLRPNGYIMTTRILAWEARRNPEFVMDATGMDFIYQHATSRQGVFAAGDCVDYIYRQGVTATAMGVEAALEIEKYLETPPIS